MGSTSYNTTRAFDNRTANSYFTKSADQIFEQNVKRQIHESMEPAKALLREARDSETHPRTVPIILGLDMTGSMGDIPLHLIRDGLPTLVGNIIQRGIPDPALLFLPVGDHEVDRYPLQVSQFESGDEELDMWLTRTYIEGGGGGNGGESYLLAWYYAAFHTTTDAWEKRKEKGFLITVGDEPNLKSLSASALKGIMGINKSETTLNEAELLRLASERWKVFHIHIEHNSHSVLAWHQLLGPNFRVVKDYKEVPKLIASIVSDSYDDLPVTPGENEVTPGKVKPL
jgi:hypothetical protein